MIDNIPMGASDNNPRRIMCLGKTYEGNRKAYDMNGLYPLTIATHCEGYHPEGKRSLTLRECASLQGFPADHQFEGNATSKARQIGNAVPPPIARLILEECKKALLRTDGLLANGMSVYFTHRATRSTANKDLGDGTIDDGGVEEFLEIEGTLSDLKIKVEDTEPKDEDSLVESDGAGTEDGNLQLDNEDAESVDKKSHYNDDDDARPADGNLELEDKDPELEESQVHSAPQDPEARVRNSKAKSCKSRMAMQDLKTKI